MDTSTKDVRKKECSLIYYVFAHQVFNTDINTSTKKTYILDFEDPEASKTWEIVRYHLEKKYKLDKEITNPFNNSIRYSYSAGFFAGYFYEDFLEHPFDYKKLKLIDEGIYLKNGDYIVIVRKPMPMGFKFYEPPSANPLPHETEEQAISAVCEGNVHKKETNSSVAEPMSNERNTTYHASVFGTYRMPKPLDNSNYICENCYIPGHFRQYCQQIGSSNYLKGQTGMIRKKPLPSGIPLTNFEKATSYEDILLKIKEKRDGDENNMYVYYDKEGFYYIYK